MPWFRIVGGGGIRTVDPFESRYDSLPVYFAVAGHVVHRQPVAEEAAKRARVDDRTGEEMRAGALSLLDDRYGNLAKPLGRLG